MLKILVVEDEAINREVAAVILTASGHRVTFAENGAEAIGLCHDQGEHFDLILMDQLMPVMGGLEAIELLRGHEATRRVPILCVSARATQGDSEAAYHAGCDHYLTKPFRRHDLLEAIALVMGDRS